MNMVKRFLTEEDAMGVVEVILIMVVLIAMVAIFKNQIRSLVENIWSSINKGAQSIYT
ncbi:MAG: Flp1 family type IVb pilin [Eubacteriales bacterium]|nr:Flp1 family type IVb pilin [Lachnospiraceae bacterium]MDO5126721.1 Flp1 family type IVb pilin [Eubacteriales bacterium]